MKRSFLLFLGLLTATRLVFAEPAFKGLADLHNHMMAEYAFAGAWFHGSHQGPIEKALPACYGNMPGTRYHGDTMFGIINEFIGKIKGSDGDTGWHFFRTQGYPSFNGWPSWDTIAHQQVWEGHLKRAYKNGLRLMVLSATDFRNLCEIMPKSSKRFACNEMESAKRQIIAAHQFADNHSWFEIATKPDDIREIIKRGNLAVVLAIEVTELFKQQDWQQSLNEYYQLGVRSIQLTHELNNDFAGAAPHHFIFKLFQLLNNIDHNIWHGFELDEQGRNKLGLTSKGKSLVRAIIEKGLILDLAHLSERAIADVIQINREYYQNQYPLFISHGHIRSLMVGKKQQEEKTTPDWVLEAIHRSSGLFGLRTGPEETKVYQPKSDNPLQQTVANNCAGSIKSFAQSVLYLKSLGLHFSIATDFNGFIQQIRPRFGAQACSAVEGNELIRQQQAQTSPLNNEFDHKGLAHIGLLPSVIDELHKLKLDTEELELAAYQFYQLWHKAAQFAVSTS